MSSDRQSEHKMPLSNISAFKLGSALGIGAGTTKSLPVRRPTALTVISNYGERFQRDINMENNTPTLRLGNWNLAYSDQEWQVSSGHESADHNLNAAQDLPGKSNVPASWIATTSSERSSVMALQLQNMVDQLQKEKNFLVLKNEAMLDMLSEVVAEMRLQEQPEK